MAVADGKAERFFVDGKVVALHPTVLLAGIIRHDDLVDEMLSRLAIRSVRRVPQPNATPVHAAVGSVRGVECALHQGGRGELRVH